MYQKLFSPIKIRGMELKNRVVMPAMGTRMADANSFITDKLIAYHRARALGGCALNIVEVSSVHTPSAPAHFVSISEDKYIEGHKKLCDAVHAAGGKAGVQLWQGSIAVGMDKNAQILMASDTPMGQFTLPGITTEQIKEVVEAFGKAAARCVEAGYDCVEFHAAHNYLPHSFLSPGLNHRTDEYGGSFENRAKFPLECIRAIRANIPEDMPLFMRIDAHDDYFPEGLTLDDTIRFCKLAKEAGVDVLDISRGNIVTPASLYEVPPIDVPRGFNVENAAKIRKETGMTTIAVGRINRPEQAEEILESDKADMVVLGRAQLADPEFCNKAQAGQAEDIIYCVGCNQGCYDGFCDVVNYPHITCMRNPLLGHEEEYKLEKTDAPKRVLIIGGGMAGLEAAKVLKERGHVPVICEASGRLGGQFVTAGAAPGKEEMRQAALSFGEQVQRMGVEVRLHTVVTPELLEEEKPEAVLFALGAEPIHIKLAGMEQKPVYDSHEVLEQAVKPDGRVCVIGGGLVGLETADLLATNGHSVTVLEMKEAAGVDLGSLRKIAVLQKMAALNVEIVANAECTEINAEGVVAKTKDGEKVFACDSVVMAVGAKARAHQALNDTCDRLQIPYHIIGDAKQARRALQAIHEGFAVARAL